MIDSKFKLYDEMIIQIPIIIDSLESIKWGLLKINEKFRTTINKNVIILGVEYIPNTKTITYKLGIKRDDDTIMNLFVIEEIILEKIIVTP